MLNACSKEAPRVRKCTNLFCTCFRLTAGPRPGGPRAGAGRAAARRRARYRRQPSLSPAGFLTVVRRPPGRSVL